MIPGNELEELLKARLEGVLPHQRVTDLITAIRDLEDEWEEVHLSHLDMGYSMSVNCADICWLADQMNRGAIIKFYRKKENHRS